MNRESFILIAFFITFGFILGFSSVNFKLRFSNITFNKASCTLPQEVFSADGYGNYAFEACETELHGAKCVSCIGFTDGEYEGQNFNIFKDDDGVFFVETGERKYFTPEYDVTQFLSF